MFWMMSRVCGSIEIGPRGLVQAMPFIAARSCIAVSRAVGLLERVIDEAHAVVTADRHEIRAHTVVGLLESRDEGLVSGLSWAAE